MTLGEMVASVREKHYPSARNAVASYILDFGGRSTHESAKDVFHRRGNYELTKRVADLGVPPELAANLVDSAYLGNEVLSGTLGSLIGKPFFSDYGFRWKDVAINRRGQDQAVAELEAQANAADVLREQKLKELAAGIAGSGGI